MIARVLKSTNGQFFVRCLADGNRQTLAHSETYTTKQSAVNCAYLLAGGGTVEDGT